MKKRVLVAEDNDDMRRLMELTLSGDPRFELALTGNGTEALKMAQDAKPDIAFLDIMMPGMDGLEVCKQLKESADTSHVKIVIVSALSQEMDQQRAIDAGADKYFGKPFSPTELLDYLENMLVD